MKIENFKELENGGATMNVELTEEESSSLINYAINHILRDKVGMNNIKISVSGGILSVNEMPEDTKIYVKEYDNEASYYVENVNGTIVERDMEDINSTVDIPKDKIEGK